MKHKTNAKNARLLSKRSANEHHYKSVVNQIDLKSKKTKYNTELKYVYFSWKIPAGLTKLFQ